MISALVRKAVSISGLGVYLAADERTACTFPVPSLYLPCTFPVPSQVYLSADERTAEERAAAADPPLDERNWNDMMLGKISSERRAEHVISPLDARISVELDPSPSAAVKGRPWPRLALDATVTTGLGITLHHSQFGSLLSIVEAIARMDRRHQFRSCGRPAQTPQRALGNAGQWWSYSARAVVMLAHDDDTAVTWFDLQRRRLQRREYLRAYAAAPSSAKARAAALEPLEERMPLDMIMRYRLLAKELSHRIKGKWWKEEGQVPKERRQRSVARPRSPKGFDWWGLFKEDEKAVTETSEVPLSELELAVRARWAVGDWPEAEVQRLLETLMDGEAEAEAARLAAASHAKDGGGADPTSLLLVGAVSLPIMSATLYSADGAGLVSFEMGGIHASVKQRAVSGLGLHVSVASLALTDLSTPWPQLRQLLKSDLAGGKAAFAMAAETEPLLSDAALQLSAEMQPIRLLLNPRFLSSLLSFLQLPPSQWAAAMELERVSSSIVRSFVGAIRSYGVEVWRSRPVHVGIVLSSPTIAWMEPPPLVAAGALPPLEMLLVQVGELVLESDESDEPLPKLRSISQVASLAEAAATPLGSEPVEPEQQDEQVFTIRLTGVGARVVPPAEASAWLTATGSADGDAGDASSPPPLPSAAAAPPLLSPFGAQLRLAVLLRTASVTVPWLTAALSVEAVRVSLSSTHAASLTSLTIGLNSCLDAVPPVALPELDDGTGRCGWFAVSERRSLQGRTETTALGTCWVYLELGCLAYEVRREGGAGGGARRALKLSEVELRGGTSAESFEVHWTSSAVGMSYSFAVTMQAPSRSLAARFLSACAAMQLRAGGVSLAPPKRWTSGVIGSKEQQARLRLEVALEEISLALLPRASYAATVVAPAASPDGPPPPPPPPPPPLGAVQLRSIGIDLDYRSRDVKATISLGSFAAQTSVPRDQMRGGGATPVRLDDSTCSSLQVVPLLYSHPLPPSGSSPPSRRSVGSEAAPRPRHSSDASPPPSAGSPMLLATFVAASEGSPFWAEAPAQLCGHLELGGLQLHLSGPALETLGQMALQFHYEISQAAVDAHQAAGGPLDEPSSGLALGGAPGAAPVGAADAAGPAALPPLPSAEEAEAEKPVLQLKLSGRRFAVVVHEEPPMHVGGAATAAATGFVQLTLGLPVVSITLGVLDVDVLASVQQLGLSAKDGLGKPPVALMRLLPAEAAATARGARGKTETRAMARVMEEAKAASAAAGDDAAAAAATAATGLPPVVAATAGAAPFLAFGLWMWDEHSPQFPGYGTELELELNPVRMLLPAHLLRRVQLCVQRLLARFQETMVVLGDQLRECARPLPRPLRRAPLKSTRPTRLQVRLGRCVRGWPHGSRRGGAQHKAAHLLALAASGGALALRTRRGPARAHRRCHRRQPFQRRGRWRRRQDGDQ